MDFRKCASVCGGSIRSWMDRHSHNPHADSSRATGKNQSSLNTGWQHKKHINHSLYFQFLLRQAFSDDEASTRLL